MSSKEMTVISGGKLWEKIVSYFEWKIPDCLCLIRKTFNMYKSPNFESLDDIWALRISKWQNKIFIRLLVQERRMGRKNSFKLSVLKTDGTEYESIEGSEFTPLQAIFTSSKCLMLTEDDLWRNDVAPYGVLTISCTITYYRAADIPEEPKMSSESEDQYSEYSLDVLFNISDEEESEKSTNLNLTGVEKLSQNLKDLLFSGEDFDTTINVKDRQFRAHRLILGVRSPVFKSMFKHDTTERSSGVISISDCDPEVFQDFLVYLYSGKVEKFTIENVFELYTVADKYDTEEVKLGCVEFMLNNISVDSFCDILILAVLHEERELLKKTTDFFVKNAKKIIITVKWQCFHKEYPVESNELFIKALAFVSPD